MGQYYPKVLKVDHQWISHDKAAVPHHGKLSQPDERLNSKQLAKNLGGRGGFGQESRSGYQAKY